MQIWMGGHLQQNGQAGRLRPDTPALLIPATGLELCRRGGGRVYTMDRAQPSMYVHVIKAVWRRHAVHAVNVLKGG